MREAPFEARPLGPFGAEIAGIDPSRGVDEETARHLRDALARFQLLLFRDLALPPAAQIQLTRCFGDLEPGLALRPEGHQVPGHPNVLYLSNKPDSPTAEYGTAWHSDGLAYARKPHGITMLHCMACPAGVGGTLFANQYRAYATMPERLRGTLRGLYWHLPRIPYSELPEDRGLAQPMVRTHSHTGREFLFCSPSARQIRGKTCRESEDILQAVREQQVRKEVVYCHAWRERDTVIWENCTLLHCRADLVNFATQGLRAMHRSATSGVFEAIECEPAEY